MKHQKTTFRARLIIALTTALFWWLLEPFTPCLGLLPDPSRWLR